MQEASVRLDDLKTYKSSRLELVTDDAIFGTIIEISAIANASSPCFDLSHTNGSLRYNAFYMRATSEDYWAKIWYVNRVLAMMVKKGETRLLVISGHHHVFMRVFSRNNPVFRGKEDEAKDIWNKASMLSKEFRIHNLLKVPMLSAQLDVRKWVKPPKNYIKINSDASTGNNRIGYGVIIRDEDGFVLGGGGGGGFKDVQLSFEEAEWTGQQNKWLENGSDDYW
ncbi:hypothetical protein PVK06_015829 [Gossypium arboreum]|uniref:RNase H type-1 domain-containing protein n=1 Tax=Gossypium arboreum TaxID=29729 RepID=A0ABR0PYA9_GOSAR|nr:hypothetical protein PVK06_015829 [Gossypium arboreum]